MQAGGLHCRAQPENNRRRGGQRRAEQQESPIHAEGEPFRRVFREQGEHSAQGHVAHENTEQAAERRQDQALGQKLADDGGAGGSDGCADGDLPRPRRAPHQH